MPELFDLSHVVADGLVTYPGLPAPVITEFLSRDESARRSGTDVSVAIGRIDMVANTGTYVDVPSHRYVEGHDLADLPLAHVAALPGIVIDATGTRAIGPEVLGDRDLAGRAVLLRTGRDVDFGTSAYAQDAPFLTGQGAEALLDAGAALVGIDAVNLDSMDDPHRPAHSRLLAADVPIVEHLTGLDALGAEPFTFFAVPVKVRGLGTFPVRAFALREPAAG